MSFGGYNQRASYNRQQSQDPYEKIAKQPAQMYGNQMGQQRQSHGDFNGMPTKSSLIRSNSRSGSQDPAYKSPFQQLGQKVMENGYSKQRITGGNAPDLNMARHGSQNYGQNVGKGPSQFNIHNPRNGLDNTPKHSSMQGYDYEQQMSYSHNNFANAPASRQKQTVQNGNTQRYQGQMKPPSKGPTKYVGVQKTLPPRARGNNNSTGISRRQPTYANQPTIKVPSKGYDLDNLPPEAFEAPQQQFKAVAQDDLRECRSCKRSFNPDSLLRHQKICNKVFNQKRKTYNTAAHRQVEAQQKQLKQQAEKKVGRTGGSRKEQMLKQPGAPSKWEIQSYQLRNAMKAARVVSQPQQRSIQPQNNYGRQRGPPQKQAQGPAVPMRGPRGGGGGNGGGRPGGVERAPAFDQEFMKQFEEADDRVQCQYCGRKFGEVQAERHIPVCKEKSKRIPAMRR